MGQKPNSGRSSKRKPATQVRLDSELKDILMRVGDDHTRSLTYIVNEACWYWVEKMKIPHNGSKRATRPPQKWGVTDEC